MLLEGRRLAEMQLGSLVAGVCKRWELDGEPGVEYTTRWTFVLDLFVTQYRLKLIHARRHSQKVTVNFLQFLRMVGVPDREVKLILRNF